MSSWQWSVGTGEQALGPHANTGCFASVQLHLLTLMPQHEYEEKPVTSPDQLESLRHIKVAEQMVYSRAFIDHLISEAEASQSGEAPQESPERTKRILSLIVSSQVEVINALGHLDERLRAQQEWARNLAEKLVKRQQ